MHSFLGEAAQQSSDFFWKGQVAQALRVNKAAMANRGVMSLDMTRRGLAQFRAIGINLSAQTSSDSGFPPLAMRNGVRNPRLFLGSLNHPRMKRRIMMMRKRSAFASSLTAPSPPIPRSFPLRECGGPLISPA